VIPIEAANALMMADYRRRTSFAHAIDRPLLKSRWSVAEDRSWPGRAAGVRYRRSVGDRPVATQCAQTATTETDPLLPVTSDSFRGRQLLK